MKKVWEQEVLLLLGCPALLISVNEVERLRKNGLLEIIAAHRTVADLDELLKRDKYYQEEWPARSGRWNDRGDGFI